MPGAVPRQEQAKSTTSLWSQKLYPTVATCNSISSYSKQTRKKRVGHLRRQSTKPPHLAQATSFQSVTIIFSTQMETMASICSVRNDLRLRLTPIALRSKTPIPWLLQL